MKNENYARFLANYARFPWWDCASGPLPGSLHRRRVPDSTGRTGRLNSQAAQCSLPGLSDPPSSRIKSDTLIRSRGGRLFSRMKRPGIQVQALVINIHYLVINIHKKVDLTTAFSPRLLPWLNYRF